MTPLLPYSTALLLGSLHAFEADHMAAVTSFAVRRPSLREAARFGVHWAVGHGGAIIVVGAALLLLGVRFPEATEHLLERLVGVVMIGLGVWTFLSARRLHTHGPAAAVDASTVDGATVADATVHDVTADDVTVDASVPHSHADETAPAHIHGSRHRHTATAVGVVHGLAGSGAAVALVPVVALDNPLAGIVYLAVFALGTILAMAVYGVLAGAVVGRTSRTSLRLARLVARVTGVATVVIGVIWLAG